MTPGTEVTSPRYMGIAGAAAHTPAGLDAAAGFAPAGCELAAGYEPQVAAEWASVRTEQTILLPDSHLLCLLKEKKSGIISVLLVLDLSMTHK